MIEIRNLEIKFGAKTVLNGVNLDVREGEIVTIIGESGCGKSTLLKSIIRFLRPASGTIKVKGVEIQNLNERKITRVRKDIGMVFQNGALFDSMTVAENVSFPLREHTRMKKSGIRERMREMLHTLGLDGAEKLMPEELSGGMKKRVGLARALILKPRIMLYDEPTTGLDPVMRLSIDRLILETRNKFNVTSVVVSHDMESVFRISDRIAMIHQGRIIIEGDREALETSELEPVRRFVHSEAVMT